MPGALPPAAPGWCSSNPPRSSAAAAAPSAISASGTTPSSRISARLPISSAAMARCPASSSAMPGGGRASSVPGRAAGRCSPRRRSKTGRAGRSSARARSRPARASRRRARSAPTRSARRWRPGAKPRGAPMPRDSRCSRYPRRPWLSHSPVPVAARQPARRRLWRLRAEPQALCPRGGGGGARPLAAAEAALPAPLGRG